ncbi:MAG: ANTAR domain-containing protein [Subdoligranulum sp.]|nr:ANTAR domain-containing protein [Subdoligranulum sp.]MCI7542689.1 ANTAR domain-containing protein [Subdoligranulum sp.]MDD7265891.1 ANTAR domain-containing protein [Subdoligranulum sp.]MDY5922428.1 ANTAR domain-containing protein [Oscillospiraceae bacterium]
MVTGKRKYRVLVAGANDKLGESIAALLPKNEYEPPVFAASVGEIRRLALESTMDLVVLNTPLKDEFGTRLALDLADYNIAVLLMVQGDVFDQVCYKVEDYGVLTLAKPVSRQSFYTAVKLLTAMRAKMLRMEKKNQALQEKMQDIRTINRAKWLLITNLQMTEDEAHYHIEKKAMNSRLSRREAAEEIIRTYDP